MKDKITWEDVQLFDYISTIEHLYIPNIDDYKYRFNIEIGNQSTERVEKIETPVFGYSEITTIFTKANRQNNYNNNQSV